MSVHTCYVWKTIPRIPSYAHRALQWIFGEGKVMLMRESSLKVREYTPHPSGILGQNLGSIGSNPSGAIAPSGWLPLPLPRCAGKIPYFSAPCQYCSTIQAAAWRRKFLQFNTYYNKILSHENVSVLTTSPATEAVVMIRPPFPPFDLLMRSTA